MDVIELDAASHGRVEQARDLRERAMFGPAKSRYKVYIIDEAHMVSKEGFNALLKLVEEPPEHVRFIFATTEADKVLPTIRSRTHNYGFRLVPVKILQEHLVMVCASEEIPADPAALALIARAGTGSVRDSLSILGQVISGCGPEGVTYQEAVLQLGVTDSALLDETVNALIDRDGAALFTAVDRVIESGNEPRRFVTDLLERVRDLIVLQRIPGAAESGLIHAPEEVIAIEVDQASRIGAAELARAGDLVNRALSEIKGATAPRLQLELLMAKLLLPATDDSTDGLLARVELLERSGVVNHAPAAAQATPVATEAAPPPAPPVPAPPVPAPPKKPAKPAAKEPVEDTPKPVATQALVPNLGNTTVASFISMWPAVMDALLKYSRVAWMGFTESTPLSFENGVLAVGVKDSGRYNNVKSGGHDERLRQAILDVLEIDTKIDVVLGAKGVVGGATVPPVPEEEDAPSMDDSASSEVTGADLIAQELGGVSIGEIENG
jgi:DNA polymerase-3 subunit gamma/tau